MHTASPGVAIRPPPPVHHPTCFNATHTLQTHLSNLITDPACPAAPTAVTVVTVPPGPPSPYNSLPVDDRDRCSLLFEDLPRSFLSCTLQA